ncbi:Asp/Glu/Hydantoin racemase [Actinomadura rubteroloni]|uniref:Asp/Glu/Hydantoin racemase n=1 Tax=Actinomadura rubteroloni TaxID=1926885 RepID=A0A2P4UIW3_9ACTN|nr:aspartate/glutamate racemase family protein [Actinomadura rubteroloni]POM24948.1 Asp/Glu/Hydantoin racemase [Actinomadura rubteroloni]
MIRITLVNPNTAREMTEAIGRGARAVAASGTVVTAVGPAMGPASVESHYDAALAVPGVLAEIAAAPDADGFVIACFGDPGLDAAREVASGPVVGIAEAAMHTATLLGRGFSIVTTLARTIGRTEELAHRYGFAAACRGVHACDVPVLELDSPSARAAVLDRCAAALATDRSDVLVLGCAGMTELTGAISAKLGVPVVDGVAAATKLVESLVALGLRTSTHGEYAPPPPKPQAGLLAEFTRSFE